MAVGKGKGRGKGGTPKKGLPTYDIIPHEFFHDLGSQVDDLLLQHVQSKISPQQEEFDAPPNARDPFKPPVQKRDPFAVLQKSTDSSGSTSPPKAITEEEKKQKVMDILARPNTAAERRKAERQAAEKQAAAERQAALAAQSAGPSAASDQAQSSSSAAEQTLHPSEVKRDPRPRQTPERHPQPDPHHAATITTTSAKVQPRERELLGAGESPTYGNELSQAMDLDAQLGYLAKMRNMQQGATAAKGQESPETAKRKGPDHLGGFRHRFEPAGRLVDHRANTFEEALNRLRQYLLMRFGTFRHAFHQLELAVEPIGPASIVRYNAMRGMRPHDHVNGMLRLREFMNAITALVPNWSEIAGVGKLRSLFKSIDDNGSGFINFEELMGVPVQHELADKPYVHNLGAQSYSFYHQRNPIRWSHNPHRINGRGETFELLGEIGQEKEDRIRALAPEFVPMHKMDLHEHDDGQYSLGSDGHSSEEELDLEHIKLRLRAAGLRARLNWKKVFHHYDHRHTGEISWHEFRSIVRKDAAVTIEVLTERDLKELFYSNDVVKLALGDGIYYEGLLKWLEPKPTQEELAILKQEMDDVERHKTRHFHKTAFLRTLEVERRKVENDHHGHMSCNPCTKLCPLCKKVILVSSWAAHAHGCAQKVRMAKDKEQQENEMMKNCFTPWISERAKRSRSTFQQAVTLKRQKRREQMLGIIPAEPATFPIREARKAKLAEEHHVRSNAELHFKPAINQRSRYIHKMVHMAGQETCDRLAVLRPAHRIPESERREEPVEYNPVPQFVPQITVRGVQKGMERAGQNIFHRLHHGTPDVANFVDPGVELHEDALVYHTTKHVLRAKKPVGLGEKNWAKVKHEQQCTYEDMIEKRRAAKEDFEGSPASTAFPEDGGDITGGETPGMSSQGVTPGAPTTPGGASNAGGAGALAGHIRASLAGGGGSAAALAAQLAPYANDIDQQSSVSENEPHVILGTEKLMGLLTRCQRAQHVKAVTAPESEDEW